MIGVGINENVVIASAVINDKKRLVITLEEAGTKKKSLFDEALTAGVQADSSSMSLNLFGPMIPKKTEMTDAKKSDMMHEDIKKLRNQLTQMCEQFMLSADCDLATFDVQFAGTGITSENYSERLLDQDCLNRIYDNLSRRFVELITPFTNNPEFAVRFKLVRQSADKHFATIPGRYILENPFIELMAVPKENSRVKFTDYEVAQKLNDGTPSSAATAEKKEIGTAAGTTAAQSVLPANPFAAQ